ncbi:hypothetical protein K1719_044430 [Acacia pycnantha]|nr:hypothetical protein K1719_044430 [Acacia pycnantha]
MLVVGKNHKHGNSNIKSCFETDKQALLKLKVEFIDNFGILSSWKQEADCCEWNGISCNCLTGHVTKMQVSHNDSVYLEGKLPHCWRQFISLEVLILANNNFSGNTIFNCSWRAAYFQFFTNMYDWIYVRLAILKAVMKRRFQDSMVAGKDG